MPIDSPSPIRLLLVDDHEILRFGLCSLINASRTVKVVGEAGTVAEALAQVQQLTPDVVLMDVRLPDGSGAEACREIRGICPETKVLFLTSYADESAVMAAVLGGAHGYLLKDVRGSALIEAIMTVATGQSILDPAVTQSVFTQMRALTPSGRGEPSPPAFSVQQQRVLALLSEGQSNKEIAQTLGLSEKTIRNYLHHIYRKLHVKSRTKAAVLFSTHPPA
jgi:DNA-binding NarL/FixJ family response regulator